jgi:hypothetical protein
MVKGLTEAVPTCEVGYEPERPAASLIRTPFVGRTAGLSRLRQRLQEARGGRGGLAVMVCEPGIGRMRLLEERADAARFAPGGRVLLLGAYRNVELDRNPGLVDALGVLPHESTYEHLRLAGVGHDEVGELLATLADQPSLVPSRSSREAMMYASSCTSGLPRASRREAVETAGGWEYPG